MSDTHTFKHARRGRLTDQERARLFLERGGRCHKCSRKIDAGDIWIDEHLIALENGGTNDWDNRVLTCSWCKPRKDRTDHSQAAKGRAQAVRHIIPTSQRQTKGKPLPGTRRSGWRKRVDGRVERRQ